MFSFWKITLFFSYSKKHFWTHMITYNVLFISKKYFREKLRKVLVHRVISNFNLLILPKKEAILFIAIVNGCQNNEKDNTLGLQGSDIQWGTYSQSC